MKVLITNGSRVGEWYFGRAGDVIEVTEIKGDYYLHGAYGVRKEDGELLYTEKEYNDMENHYMKSLEEANNSKKVKLPLEVVREIEWIRGRNNGNHHWKWKIIDLIWKKDMGTHYLQTKVVFDKVLQALVNGYEIEETPGERIQRGIKEIYDKWNNEPPNKGGWEVQLNDLAKRIYRYVKDELEQENNQSG